MVSKLRCLRGKSPCSFKSLQALKDQGAGDDAELNSEVQRKVEELQRVDEGVATVLLTAAQAEVARLRSAAEAAATAQASLQHLSEVGILSRQSNSPFVASPRYRLLSAMVEARSIYRLDYSGVF